MEKYKNKLELLFAYLRGAFKNNLLLVGFVFSAVLSDFILRLLTVGNVLKIKPVITSIAIVLIVSILVVALANKKRPYVYIIASVLLALLNVANYMYYTHFNSFISVNVFNQAKHLSEMKNNVSSTLNLKMVLFFIPILLLVYVYRRLKKNHYFEMGQRNFSIRKNVLAPFLMGFVLLLGISVTLSSTDISRLVKQWNREYLVEQFGIYTFATADIVKAASVPKAAQVNFDDYKPKLDDLFTKNQAAKMVNKYTGVLEGRDLYVIHYESGQRFAMNLAFADGEVTPFLNKIAREGMFFNNFYPQHSVGTSSDSEFTFSTSLYPINNRTVFIDHADKDFVTMQKLLKDKGYHTMSLHGNNGSFWNRNLMYPNMGYDEFLSKSSYQIDEEVGLGLSDMSFYRQSVEMIKKRKEEEKPLMATLITLSNHYPFDELESYGEFDTGYLEGSKVSNYLKSLHYADKALASLFQQMDQEGLLDNAVVVLYGDHHAKISKSDYEMIYNYDPETGLVRDREDPTYRTVDKALLRQARRTPLIFWTKDGVLHERVEEYMGMIDVLPTLANMLNIYDPYALGKDIFNIENNTIIFPDGSFLNKDYYYSSSDLEVYSMEDNQLLYTDKDLTPEIQEKISSAEDTLELSTDIIVNNLVKKYGQSLGGK